jgi:hypothetical protein
VTHELACTFLAREEPTAAPNSRTRGGVGYSILAVIGLIVAAYVGASIWCGTIGHLRSHLVVRLGAELRTEQGRREVAFGVRTGARGAPVVLSGELITIRANARVVRTPPFADKPIDAVEYPSTREIRFFYMSEPELIDWLGGVGTYSLTATVGPVESEPVVVHLPGLRVGSPCTFEELQSTAR